MENTNRKRGFSWGKVIFLVFVALLVYVLNTPLGSLPAIGRLLDPVNGCWANAEPADQNFSANYQFPGVQPATVWIDDQMVPHIHAANEHDLYFIQGYIHARFRLWQMDLQTRAAAGRVSEVVGDKALAFDRKQRRKGMVYAAEKSLAAGESDERSKKMLDAYTEGINHYISTLTYRDYPLEYKLMGFAPEKWHNLKSALLLKYMADDLTGKTDDIAFSYLREVLSPAEFDLLFPLKVAGSTPVMPRGTVFDSVSLKVPAAPADSLAFPHFTPADFEDKHDDGKGSNNWAISGARTASGAAILCDDPHLGLNLPSLWFTIQLQAPGINVFGVSLPGAPGIDIGFNDSLAWGLTNNYRDVKDYYLIKPVAESKGKYWFAGRQLDYAKRVEVVKVKGRPDVIDTIDYTIHGPVFYPENNGKDGGLKKPVAMCWMAHRGTNELLAVYLMNRARGYNDYVEAILNFQCPGQNFVYADRRGNIALWGQGQFVNKWPGQGRFIMNGEDSSTLWKELIPMRENPHVLNPAQGYVSSANQSQTDDAYPYWYNGDFVELRAWRINQLLAGMQKATVQDMFAMQNETYSWLAAGALPAMLNIVTPSVAGSKYMPDLQAWDYKLAADSKGATIFQVWWNIFAKELWAEYADKVPGGVKPTDERLMQLLKPDSSAAGEEVLTARRKHDAKMKQVLVVSYKHAEDSLAKLEKGAGLQWYKVKNTSVSHLAKLPAFSFDSLKIGGWGNAINAVKGSNGPSWRMVVQMGQEIEAYGVYPGGQSGNPGSKYYADYLQHWVEGKYYRLHFLPNTDKQDNSSIRYTWKVN